MRRPHLLGLLAGVSLGLCVTTACGWTASYCHSGQPNGVHVNFAIGEARIVAGSCSGELFADFMSPGPDVVQVYDRRLTSPYFRAAGLAASLWDGDVSVGGNGSTIDLEWGGFFVGRGYAVIAVLGRPMTICGRGMSFGIPHWAVVAISSILPVRWIWLRHRNGVKDRRSPDHCRRCGYDLRATPLVCPECGTVPGIS
jgi:hypothetical protein